MQAPDIIISDLDSRFKVLPSEFSIEERLVFDYFYRAACTITLLALYCIERRYIYISYSIYTPLLKCCRVFQAAALF